MGAGRSRREEVFGTVVNLGPEHQHTGALVGLVFAAVALVGLGTGFLVGWAGDGSPQDVASGSTSSTASPSSPSPSSESPSSESPSGSPSKKTKPTTRAASEIERDRRNDLGYVVGARLAGDGMHVSFDRALLFFGQDARREARSRGLQGQLRDGRLLVNQNPLLRDLVLSPDVRVLGGPRLANSGTLEPVPLESFLDAVGAGGSELLLELRFDRLGYLVEIREKDLSA
jgi:hypothetical protein